MRRRCAFLALLLLAGCGGGDPESSRLRVGDEVLFVTVGECTPYVVTAPGAKGVQTKSVNPAPGDRGRVEDDSAAERVISDPDELDGIGLPADRACSLRGVRVLVLDGPAKGSVGLAPRCLIRPAR